MLYRTVLLVLAIGAYSSQTHAQVADTTSRKAEILIEQDANRVSLKAETPPLVQIAGAPEAFYTYFWEFGNGKYSFEENPEYVFPEKGEYEVRLQVTNNYDNGKAPPSRPKKVSVNTTSHPPITNPQEDDFGTFAMIKNREPVPGEELVVIMRYKNNLDELTKGKLYVFYNEVKYRADNFELVDVRTHHGETRAERNAILSALQPKTSSAYLACISCPTLPYQIDSASTEPLYQTIDRSEEEFRNSFMIQFDQMQPGDQRNIFFTLKTTPEMLQDTSAIIKVRGVYVPDSRSNNHEIEDLEMEIITSHDPNKMAVYNSRLNYRFASKNKIKYKIRFQNNGEGPANMIRLDVDMPQHLDKSTLEVLDMHPKCPICPDDSLPVSTSCLDTLIGKDQVSFVFKNIYLPGSNQDGVSKYDSTKGFVKYSIRLSDKPPKKNTVSRTAIIFDKNEPILTNYSRSYFKPGISIGAMAGYNAISALENSSNYFFGATISPYKPYGLYLQAEAQMSFGSYETTSFSETSTFDPATRLTEIEEVSDTSQYSYTRITLIPASLRYNLNQFIGFGAGVLTNFKLSETRDYETHYNYFIQFQPGADREPNPDKSQVETGSSQIKWLDFTPGIFADVNIGLARIGPSAGLRYSVQTIEPRGQWSFYLIWRL